MENATHTVRLGAERHLVNETNLNAVVEELIAKNGGKFEGIKVEPLDAKLNGEPVSAPVRGATVDAAGAARSQADADLAKASGFAPAQPLFTRGTMVNELGVENARRSRLEHERKPTVLDACSDLAARVRAEGRLDQVVPAASLRMRTGGNLVEAAEGEQRELGMLSPRAFGSLLSLTGIGGHKYLERCPPLLRARNVNSWLSGRDGCAVPANDLMLRRRHGGSEVFAVTSASYTPVDTDVVADVVARAFSGDQARAAVDYDGFRARIEAVYHSDVRPEDYVAGEFFKAGVIIRTDDTGGGSLSISGCLWQNLCLNLIIVDRDEQVIDAIRHVGDPAKILERLEAAIAKARAAVAPFLCQWGYACHEDLVAQVQRMQSGVVPIEQVIHGFFDGVIERELVPVRGRRQDVVKQLHTMHDKDRSGATKHAPVTRASVVNAFTRWAHEVNQDPWLADDVARAAGRLVASTKPLPFLPIELKG